MFLHDCVFEKLDLCILSVAAVFQILGVVAGPALREIAEILKKGLSAVHKPLGHQKLHADKIIVIADTIAYIAVSVHSEGQEGVHCEPGHVDNKEVVVHTGNVELLLEVALGNHVRHELELVELHGYCVRGLRVGLTPLPADLQHRRRRLVAPPVRLVVENAEVRTIAVALHRRNLRNSNLAHVLFPLKLGRC